jgi:hypothetical protein
MTTARDGCLRYGEAANEPGDHAVVTPPTSGRKILRRTTSDCRTIGSRGTDGLGVWVQFGAPWVHLGRSFAGSRLSPRPGRDPLGNGNLFAWSGRRGFGFARAPQERVP